MKKFREKKNFFFQKSEIFYLFFLLPKKKLCPLSFPILGGRVSTRALQSIPFHNRGGQHEHDKEVQSPDERKSNIGCIPLMLCCIVLTWVLPKPLIETVQRPLISPLSHVVTSNIGYSFEKLPLFPSRSFLSKFLITLKQVTYEKKT